MTHNGYWRGLYACSVPVDKISDVSEGGSDRYYNEVTAHHLPEITPLTVFKKQTP
jgi:hypothetical protein